MEVGRRYLAWTGVSVAAGGVLTFVVNAGLTPWLDADVAFSETAASSLFLWRQSLSAVAALLLLFGAVGLYLRQAPVAGGFGAVAFFLAFVGSALLLATEWGQVFIVRNLAISVPEALQTMENAEGASLFDIGAMVALSVFTLGWIAFAGSMMRAGVYPRVGPVLLVAGFFAVPILAGISRGAWGAIPGNAVLGVGWVLLGREVARNDESRVDDSRRDRAAEGR